MLIPATIQPNALITLTDGRNYVVEARSERDGTCYAITAHPFRNGVPMPGVHVLSGFQVEGCEVTPVEADDLIGPGYHRLSF